MIAEVISYETYTKVVAERDAWRDLLERAIIAAAVFRYGALCSGKIITLDTYRFRIVQTTGVLQAMLIQEEGE